MKKRKTRFLKRLFILVLCLCLVSGTVINKNKISAHAAGLTLTLGSYTAYEICLYVGTLLIGSLGIGVAIDNRDEIAEMGKNFIDSMELDDLKEWLLTKVTSDGQSYVFGSGALKEVQDMEFSVIQGGGNMPENNEDNDNDGDIDAEDRTEELKNLGLWATSSFADLICDQIQPLLDDYRSGSNSFLENYIGPHEIYEEGLFYDGKLKPDSNGYFQYKGISYGYEDGYYWKDVFTCSTRARVGGYINYNNHGGRMEHRGGSFFTYRYKLLNGVWVESGKSSGWGDHPAQNSYYCNFPVFATLNQAVEYSNTGEIGDVLNYPKVYQIADWLQEDWTGLLESINVGIRSLNDNMLIIGEAMNQALKNQLSGLGYISAIDEGIANAVPLDLPDIIVEPIYYPVDDNVPKLDADKLPWYNPENSPGASPGGDDPNPPDSDEGNTDDDNLDPKDSFGLNTLFGILIVLIEILIALLIIFLSCLVFITTIFRIPPQQGFLPDEMVMSLEYLKTLIIPGLGISVWSFFMALIYIILIFTVIGILRKNIDKIRFPRRRI